MLTEGMYLADRYEIVGKVGAGGMSDVYKAKDHILSRFVAVKVLKAEFSDDMNFVTKFRTEAQSAAGLEHPNIVNIYDVGSENGMHYIVMEYVEGITLKTYIEKKGQLAFKEAVSIAIQVARGIEAAHNKNIIHRDIKPQNIIISTEGKVKVTDFGIARAASSNTISSDVMGSVHYASPEQARNGFVDGRSDIYSLGIMMYEMVTGRVPFDGDTTVAVAIQHLQEEMVVPSAYASNLPISMEKIILKCTQKNADRRYQTIAELLTDLRKSLISPNEDFVVMIPAVDTGKTKVISDEELRQINEETSGITADEPEDTDGEEAEIDEEDEDEEEGSLNPKLDKAVTIMGIVIAVVIVIAIIYLLGSVFGLFRGGNRNNNTETQQTETETETETESEAVTYSMIDITGMTEEEAEEALERANMDVTIFVAAQEESDEYEEGEIIEQDPAVGREIEEGGTVNVIICGEPTNARTVRIPNVVNYTAAEAEQTLKDSGLVVVRAYEYSSEVASGSVMSTNPAAGTTVNSGTSVTITISQGVRSVAVPGVVGSDSATAESTLTNAGLVVTKVEEFSSTVASGYVMGQSLEAGRTVAEGTAITITVSKGAEPVYYEFSYVLRLPSTITEIPEGASASFVATLRDRSGNTIQTWSDTFTDVGDTYSLGVRNASMSSATLHVVWTYTDVDGTTSTHNPDDVPISLTQMSNEGQSNN